MNIPGDNTETDGEESTRRGDGGGAEGGVKEGTEEDTVSEIDAEEGTERGDDGDAEGGAKEGTEEGCGDNCVSCVCNIESDDGVGGDKLIVISSCM